MSNSFRFMGLYDQVILETWSIIESIDKKAEVNQNKNISIKQEETIIVENINNGSNNDVDDQSLKFDWLLAIKDLLLKKESKEIKIKRLKKNVK